MSTPRSLPISALLGALMAVPAFAQQFQSMGHRNSAAPRMAKDPAGKEYDANQLMDIGWGFNLPTANLGLNAQLAPGVRVRLPGIAGDVGVDRMALAGGWLVTPTILLKGEYVRQKYNDFPATDIRSGGEFDGFIIEGAVSF